MLVVGPCWKYVVIGERRSGIRRGEVMKAPWIGKGTGKVEKTSIMFLEVIQEMKDCRYEPVDCRTWSDVLGRELVEEDRDSGSTHKS